MSKLALVIDSCYEHVNLVGLCVEFLASQRFDESHSYQIQTCVVEAVTNCIEHSYREAKGHTVTIGYQMDEAGITIDISDTGVAMDPRVFMEIPKKFDYDPMDIENLPEGGFGIKVIKMWMDEVRYASEDGRNHLILVKRTRPGGGIPAD